MATKICEVCGKPFESNYPKALYCSTECRTKGESWKNQERYRKRNGKPLTDDYKKPKICSVCGKVITKGNRTKYCSKTCANKAKFQNAPSKKVLRKKNETLCWTCQNACGGCSWSRSFEPVEGWEAKPSADSFFVINCPQFIPDEVRKEKGK
jgi:predicted nucleic acid-binding Zn ribbon protein